MWQGLLTLLLNPANGLTHITHCLSEDKMHKQAPYKTKLICHTYESKTEKAFLCVIVYGFQSRFIEKYQGNKPENIKVCNAEIKR